MKSDFRIHNLLPEASWAGRYANLTPDEVVALVTTNVEKILQLKPSKDLVVFEGSPLEFGGTVVLSLVSNDETDELELATCFPREDESA